MTSWQSILPAAALGGAAYAIEPSGASTDQQVAQVGAAAAVGLGVGLCIFDRDYVLGGTLVVLGAGIFALSGK